MNMLALREPRMPSLFDAVMRDMFHSGTDMGADVRVTDEAYLFDIEVPGVDRGDICVELDNDVLRVAVSIDRPADEGEYVQQGRYQYRRRWAWRLRDIDAENVEATMEDGVLHLSVPRTEEPAHRIEIT